MEDKTLYVSTREEWREWLAKNHDKEPRIWLIYYKKHTGKPSIPYDDAVEEALCYGWIDSLIRRIDEERYMQKYTPRKLKSTWSRPNVRRVWKMIEQGKMMPKGLELWEFAIENGLLPDMDEAVDSGELFPEVPDYFWEALNKNPKAEKYFTELAPSYKLQYLAWIMDAKREETKNKRLDEAIRLLESGQKLGMK